MEHQQELLHSMLMEVQLLNLVKIQRLQLPILLMVGIPLLPEEQNVVIMELLIRHQQQKLFMHNGEVLQELLVQ